MADVEKLLCSISFCAEALQDANSPVWAGLSRAKLGLAGCLQLFLSMVWRGLYPMHGERLERSCSCASNCAHLHSPHHPPRRPENRRVQRMEHGSSGMGVDRRKGQERELEGQADGAPEHSHINSLQGPVSLSNTLLLISPAHASPHVKLLFLVYHSN